MEPFVASRRNRVCRDVEACCEVLPEIGVRRGQYYDDLRPGQRPGEIVDRMCQDGQAAQHRELLGARTSHAGSAPACYDDDSYLLFHISFFPNPSVLSVNFIKSGAIAHRVSSASAA
jgi:hypothetical protein